MCSINIDLTPNLKFVYNRIFYLPIFLLFIVLKDMNKYSNKNLVEFRNQKDVYVIFGFVILSNCNFRFTTSRVYIVLYILLYKL